MSELLKTILTRCVEEGDCLLWQGMTSHSGMPAMKHEGKSKAMVRRVAYLELHGQIPEGRLVTPICGNKLCLNPQHLQALTPAHSKQVAARHGAYSSAAKVRKRMLTVRANSRISDEVVAAVRQAEDAREAAREFGISQAYAYAIKGGRARVDMQSPFAGLGAR